jgi:anhydro-N-acetylmuramic acid kinase
MLETRLIAGAMSGTSADGVDVAIVRIEGRGQNMAAQLVHWHHRAYPGGLRQAIYEIRLGTPTPLSILAGVGRELTLAHAAAVNEALVAAHLSSDRLAAVAAHGQTLYHDPPDTIQWLDPALLAAEVGAVVVSDFRRADCAVGGQGAPLVPLADFILLRHSQKNRVLLNIGGIANITYLRAGAKLDDLIAFDTGPGNCISDHLSRQFDPHGPGWDVEGHLASRGVPIYPLVQQVLADPYFAKPPPKSTDGPAMVERFTDALTEIGRKFPLENLLRSACLISADTILAAIRQFCKPFPDEIIISGGGTKNLTLMSLLRQPLGEVPIRSSEEVGIPSAAKEAMAFALLGAATLDGIPGNVPAATGARRAVVLGSITPWRSA